MPIFGGGTGTPVPNTPPPSGLTFINAPAPLLSVEQWRMQFSYNPWHFWGLAHTTKAPVSSACNTIVKKYAWQQADICGREDIERAIMSAETKLFNYLGYSVAPRYTEETIFWPRYKDTGIWRGMHGVGADGRRIGLKLPEGYVHEIGTESIASIGDAAVSLVDTDGDGLFDTFTASAATSETDANKIAIYFTTTDRLNGDEIGPKWRIQPVKVSISGGTVSVRGPAWILVRPILYQGFTLNAIDPDVLGNYVTDVTIAFRSTETEGTTVDTAQAVLLWETVPCGGTPCCCGGCSAGISYTGSGHDPAAVGMTIARASVRDVKGGIIVAAHAVLNATTGVWSDVDWGCYREPDRITVRYLAGAPLFNQQMANKWQIVVARLAAAEMGRRICACDAALQELYHWQFDLSRAAGANDEQYSISQADLDCPFGTRRGHIDAWKQVKQMRRVGSTLI